jgi:uncharacterized Tic20 family protein
MGSVAGRPEQARARHQRGCAAAGTPAIAPLVIPAQSIGMQPAEIPAAVVRPALESGQRRGLAAGSSHAEEPAAAVPPLTAARVTACTTYLLAAVLSFIPPAVTCLLDKRKDTFLRRHAVQAMNAAFTTLLYILSSAVLAAILALDNLRLGLQAGVTAAMFCWLVTFGYLVAAAISAARGRFYQIPRSLCADLLRPHRASASKSAGAGT